MNLRILLSAFLLGILCTGACSSSHDRGGAPGVGDAAASQGGTPMEGPSGGTANKEQGTSCASLAQCCPKAANPATCALVVDQGNEISCGFELALHSAQCPPNDGPPSSGTTADNWSYFSAYDGTHPLGEFSHLFVTDTGVALADYLGLLYRSVDLGDTWQVVSRKDNIVVFGQANDSTLFARLGLGQQAQFSSQTPDLGVSTDEGQTWQALPPPPFNFGRVTDLFVRPSGGVYALGVEGRVARTQDKGQTWEFLTSPLEALKNPTSTSTLRLLVDEHETLYLFLRNELLRKHTHDSRWFSELLPAEPLDVCLLPDNTLVISTSAGILRSVTYGDDWETVSPPNGLHDLLFSAASGLLYGLDSNVQVSPDQGRSWQALGPQGISVSRFAVLPNEVVLAKETYFGVKILRSSAITLQRSSTIVAPKARDPECYDGLLNGTESDIDCGGDCRACSVWELLPDFPEGHSFITSRDEIYTKTADHVLFVSADLGHTWGSLGAGPEPIYEHSGLLYARTTNLAGDSLLTVSNDWGKTWASLGSALPELPRQLLARESSGDLLMVGLRTIYASTDGGKSWLSAYTLKSGAQISSLVELAPDGLFMLISDSNVPHIYRSDKVLSEWSALEVENVTSIVAHAGALYAGVRAQGVFQTNDAGATFTLVPGTETTGYFAFGFNSAGAILMADTRGVFANNSSVVIRGEPRVGGANNGFFVLTNDRIISSGYDSFLSVPTTSW